MMERAVEHGGRILVLATHGPTVESTQALLREVAAETGQRGQYDRRPGRRSLGGLAQGDSRGA